LLAEFKKQQNDSVPFDYTPVAQEAARRLGRDGGRLALQYYESMELSLLQNPWSRIRRVEWKDVAQLDDLFTSESLETHHGSYLDQRFIDYLSANFSAVDAMNWRKFEGLACEYLEREGYRIEISSGRNDGGIDARAWKSDAERSGPPTILVQCKRQKAKIEKVVVKALWADVVDEGAKSGLVVTTSELSPGAAAVVSARSYPIDGAERSKIRSWIEAMRTPNSGVFLGL
jgi:restriction system protein